MGRKMIKNFRINRNVLSPKIQSIALMQKTDETFL